MRYRPSSNPFDAYVFKVTKRHAGLGLTSRQIRRLGKSSTKITPIFKY
jgi:hypothetical protein